MLEKYFNLTDPGAEYDINQHLSHGWKIVHAGLTLVIMQHDDTPVFMSNGVYSEKVHNLTADQAWKAWKAQVLTVGQLATWQQRHNHYFKEENNEQL